MALLSRNRLLESHVIRKAVKRGSEGGDWKSDVPKHVLLAGRLLGLPLPADIARRGNVGELSARGGIGVVTAHRQADVHRRRHGLRNAGRVPRNLRNDIQPRNAVN